MLIGLWIAWNNYIRDPSAAGAFVRTFPAVHRFVFNKWYFDELYDRIFVRPAIWLGRLFWHRGDEKHDRPLRTPRRCVRRLRRQPHHCAASSRATSIPMRWS